MQGQSFLSCIQGADHYRDSLLIEFNDRFARNGFKQSARVRSVVTNDWQLSVYKDQDWGELYDLKSDPRQTHDLWGSVEHQSTRAGLFEELTHLLIGQLDESPRSARLV